MQIATSEEPPNRSAPRWQHAPTRALVQLAGPITLSGLSFAAMGVVDTLLVGRLGASELAGVGLGLVVTTLLMGFGFGLLRGVKVLLAQARGRGQGERALAFVGAGLWLALFLGLAMMALAELAALIVPHFAASEAAGRAARRYIVIRALGMPLILGYVALREARYGYGDTRSAMVSAILGNVCHALLDYVALHRLGLGAAGAAGANVLAFALQFGLLAFVQRPSGFGLRLANSAAVLAVVRAGAFTGLQFVLEMGSIAGLSLLLAGVSDAHMAAHQIALQLAAFCFLPALAIAESATLLSAEAVGSGALSLVRVVAHGARRVALLYAGTCALILLLGGGLIAAQFTRDPALIAVVRTVFVALAAHQLFEAVALAGQGVLRGVGATRYTAFCALSCAWLCTPTVGYVLVRVWELGAVGAWLSLTVEMACCSLLVWRHVEGGAWQRDVERERALGLGMRQSQPSVA